MSNDVNLIRNLGLHYFPKRYQEITEINSKSNQNAFAMHKFDEENWNKIQNYIKNSWFLAKPNDEICTCHNNLKNERDAIYTEIFSRLRVNILFKYLEKP